MKETEKTRPAEIERRSMEIIDAELGETPLLSERERTILKRVIHTTADFEYKENLIFSQNAVECALLSLKRGAVIVTDTNMALSGISRAALSSLSCEAYCFMADADVAASAKARGVTRASAAMDKAAELFKDKNTIFAIGNAPTALLRLCELKKEEKIAPNLIIGAPVGFVNVVLSKERLVESGGEYIAAMGRKGGSGVAAATVNALLYMLYDRK